MKRPILIITTLACLLLCSCNKLDSGPNKYVDPFIGTGGHGHTYPGAALPFGMVQLSPDTRLTGWDGCSGYHYSDSVIFGFSHTHLSGTGVSDYGDILVMPTIGDIQWNRGSAENPASGYGSSISHKTETAKPGFYSVMLDDYRIKAELTVTPRVGVHRYSFPKSNNANIIIDLTHRDEVIDSAITFVGDREIEGFRRSKAWAKDQSVYFVARFSKPFQSCGISNAGRSSRRDTPSDTDKSGFSGFHASGKDIKAFATFKTYSGESIVVKVGISAVSSGGARKNLDVEAAGKHFFKIKQQARETWKRALSKITVKNGSDAQKRIFYSALYHALLNPNLFTDIDCRFRGRDLNIHRADGCDYYTVFSLWDTYRAAHPLFTLIEPDRTNDFIKTFITQYEQGGLLPVWELAANETFCMIGYHAVPVIADAFIKGIRGYDVEKAYEAAKHSAMGDRFGLKYYKTLGYIPAEQEPESVSKTLEYAYDDWCIAQMAKALGKEADYRYFIQRAQYYKNLYDPSTGFMRARMQGIWFSPFDPAEVNFNYTEANSWQYSFYVPQDVSGLMRLMGGKDKFAAKLDALFFADSLTTGRKQADITGLIGQYAHGNEPSHHMAYLYTFAGQPWKTQKMVRRIMDTLYSDQPDGLCGNEDCGQMSAWFIFSALGFYPVTPAQDIYIIGTPLFPEASIDTGGDQPFNVIAENVSNTNFYIQSAALNGKPWPYPWLRHQDIVSGGTLVLEMGPESNTGWGSTEDVLPRSAIVEHLILPTPYVVPGTSHRIFSDSVTIELASLEPGVSLHFTLDNSTPTVDSPVYTGPLTLTETSTVKAIALKEGMSPSHVLAARFTKIPAGRSIELKTQYASQYSGGGDNALIDGIAGTGDFRTGTWQGYHGVDIDAIVDLGAQSTVKKLSIRFLQDNNAWIFMPLKVEFWASTDGKTFEKAGEVMNDVPDMQEGSIIKAFELTIPPGRIRYIRVWAENMGVCPDWHKGAGNKAWIFADELSVN